MYTNVLSTLHVHVDIRRAFLCICDLTFRCSLCMVMHLRLNIYVFAVYANVSVT